MNGQTSQGAGPSTDPLIAAAKVGALSGSSSPKSERQMEQVAYHSPGGAGLIYGGVAGVIRSPSPVIHSISCGIHWFGCGSTYWCMFDRSSNGLEVN